jgi:hypothetical protein
MFWGGKKLASDLEAALCISGNVACNARRRESVGVGHVGTDDADTDVGG